LRAQNGLEIIEICIVHAHLAGERNKQSAWEIGDSMTPDEIGHGRLPAGCEEDYAVDQQKFHTKTDRRIQGAISMQSSKHRTVFVSR